MMMTIKNFLKATLIALAILLLPALSLGQQNYLIQTTLTAAVTTPTQGVSPPSPTNLVQVASVTGITGIQLNPTLTTNQQNVWQMYVDRELMTIVALNGLTLQVLRGQGGTSAAPHASGSMVLFGRAIWFFVADPGTPSSLGGAPSIQGIGGPTNAPCVLGNVVVSPWVNIRTGSQWYCNPNTLVWTPGFNNPYLELGDYFSSAASASASAITGPVVKLTGATGITSFTFSQTLGAIGLAPSTSTSSNSLNGKFCTIGGTWATTIGNNIGTALTSTNGMKVCWYWSGTDHVWYALQ